MSYPCAEGDSRKKGDCYGNQSRMISPPSGCRKRLRLPLIDEVQDVYRRQVKINDKTHRKDRASDAPEMGNLDSGDTTRQCETSTKPSLTRRMPSHCAQGSPRRGEPILPRHYQGVVANTFVHLCGRSRKNVYGSFRTGQAGQPVGLKENDRPSDPRRYWWGNPEFPNRDRS
jgi:hypothetical protein